MISLWLALGIAALAYGVGTLLAMVVSARARATLSEGASTQTERARALQAQLTQREEECANLRMELAAAGGERSQRQAELAALQVAVEKDREAAAARLADFQQLREETTLRFKQISQDVLEDKAQRFALQNQQNLEQILLPLRERIAGFETQVKQAYELETRDRVALKEQIVQLQQLNQQVSAEANHLALALRGDSQTQGAWGELILERLLEMSGLEKGREYETQFSLRDDEGARYRPDVIVHLPAGRDLIIDAKVSLTAHARLVGAADDGERAVARRDHVASMRAHILELGRKDYHALPGITSPDFVLMFVPSEAAYIEAIRTDPTLYQDALAQNIGLVCPATLLPTLRTVENLWKTEKQGRNALAIAEEAGRLYDKFVGFEQDLAKLGNALKAAGSAYSDARGKLLEGRGNVVSKIENLRKMGAKASKQLPEGLLRESGPEGVTEEP